MRLRKQIKMLWKKNALKYGMAGALCLMVAVMLLVLNIGGQASAESVNLGDGTIDLELENGAYLIRTPEHLIALGSATNVQTSGKKFVLANDITVSSVSNVARGYFAGDFDGQGHVITIETVTIPANSEQGVINHGILFGTIAGNVENLIVDIQGNVDYTRTSKVERTDTIKDVSVVENGAPAEAPYSGVESFSSFSTDVTKKALAQSLDNATAENIISVGSTEYRRVGVNENVNKITTYELGDVGTDRFGVLCGTLAENATVSKVYIKGDSLNVLHKAGMVSTRTTQEGNRDKYFYYKAEEKDIAEDDSANITVSNVNAAEVSVYNSTSVVSDNKSDLNNVQIMVAAPQYAANGDTITYTVTLTNNRTSSITIQSLSDEGGMSGTWKKEDGTAIDAAAKIISANTTKTYKYTLNSAVAADVTAEMKASYSYTNKDVSGNDLPPGNADLICPEITTQMIDTTPSVAGGLSGTGLQLSLTPVQTNYLTETGTSTVGYVLKIKNNATYAGATRTEQTIRADGIVLEISGVEKNIEWKQNGNAFSQAVLSTGDEISLTGTVTLESGAEKTSYASEVSVTPSKKENVYENVQTYSYIANISGITGASQYGEVNYSGNPEEEAVADTYSGNHLNAGIFAGTSEGSITNSKQEMQISGNRENTTTEKLRVGGIVGQALANASASHLYILGTGSYDGQGTALPVGSATGTTSSIPTQDGNWTAYTKYTLNGSDAIANELFDLAWLVKENVFTYGDVADNKIEVSNSVQITGKPLTFAIAYNARKSMSEASEDTIYVSNTGTMELGDSGYYRLLNTYASDGYYHYTTPATALEDAGWVYPYCSPTTENPYVFDDSDIQVIRMLNPLRDIVQLQTAVTGGTHTGVVYYNVNDAGSIPTESSSNIAIATDGTVQLPFDEEEVVYQITQKIDGYIYPMQETRSVTKEERLPLPKPSVKAYNYYNESGIENDYVDFSAGGSYEATTGMRFVPNSDDGNEEKYSFRYLYSETAPESGDWDGEQRYIGSDIAIMSNANGYENSAVIPEDLAQKDNVYLYVEISRKNYDSAIFCYGPFAVTPANIISAKLTSNGQMISSDTVVDGDVVILEGIPQSASLQYMVSTVPLNSYNWANYSTDGIVMSPGAGGYVYARINYGNGKYSNVFSFNYNFGEVCSIPRITPNTGESSSGVAAATTVDSGTVISLNSRIENAQMFYLVSNVTQTLDLERVLQLPNDITADGQIGVDGYKYFEVNQRWYRTASKELQRYTDGFMMSHDENETQIFYLSAIAVAEGYEVSEAKEYIYKVGPKQKVARPEATFETRYMPGGETGEIAAVASGGTISFFTVTSGAELFYAVGSGATMPATPVPSEGIPVEGEYNTNFVVRVQAKKDGMLDSDVMTFVYTIADQETTSVPTATPGTTLEVPTVVIPGNKILLSSATREASIYYTTDGSIPLVIEETEGVYKAGNATTLLYNPNEGIVMPADGSGFFTITAVAVKSGLAKSPEIRLTYAYPNSVLEPYANMESGKVELNASVILKNLTEEATIYYTVAYGDEVPEDPTLSSSVFNQEYPFVITQKTNIKAMASKDGVKSSVVSFTFEPLTQLDIPQPSIESGAVVSRGTVLELKVAEGATVYYTMDGSDPSDGANAAVMSGKSLLLNGEPGGQITIKAYAVAVDQSQSEVGTFTYQFSQNSAGLSASIENGSLVSYGTKVNLMSDVTDAEIYYTTDGSSPIENGIGGTTVEINGTPGSSFTVKAVAIANDVPGIVSTFIYRIKEKPAAPIASPAEGTLTVATRVSLSSGAHKVYYTTDGTEPTKSSNVYTDPILINRTTTLKAIAISEDGEISEVASFLYKAAAKAEMPTSNQEDTKVQEPGTKVLLESATQNATIYYTVDGTEPTLERLNSLMIYDNEGIEINRSVTIKAVAYRQDLQLSNIATWNYSVETIPAVEMKEAEAAKQAEEGLHDTDTEGLIRDNKPKEISVGNHTIKDEIHQTSVTLAEATVAKNTVLLTKEADIERDMVNTTKKLFGDDYTVLSSYYMWLEADSNYVQTDEDVEIGIPIPEGYENATLTIVEVTSGNKMRILNTQRTDGMLYAKTGSISKYAVVGPESVDESTKSIPYLLILEVVAGLTLAGGTIYFAIEKVKKICRNKKDYPKE